jgi:chromosome segregation ATPase
MHKGEHLTDVEYLESQLQEVEGRLQEAVGLLDDLKAVQEKFKHLASTTRQLQTQADEARERLTDAQSQFGSMVEEMGRTRDDLQKGFDELKTRNEAQWAEFRDTLVKAQDDLYAAQRNLSSELALRVNELRGDVEQRLEQFAHRQEKALEEMKTELDGVHNELERHQKKLIELAHGQNTLTARAKQINVIAIVALVLALCSSVLIFVLSR